MNQQLIDDVRRLLTHYYANFGRHEMLWRQPEPDGSFDPYKILVSELMLQQTQVSRVTPKYAEFLQTFPDINTLAEATVGDVLQKWSGLGYNRRAKFLWQAVQTIRDVCGGVFPRTYEGLVKLPGVGPNTAGAILAYAYNRPIVYVETNIRTVIIHHIFPDEARVTDYAVREVVRQMVEPPDVPDSPGILEPREFYWAMMDYGAHLKATVGNLNRLSSTYSRQSVFSGSRRQLRGQVIRLLAERPHSASELADLLNDDRADPVLADLISEGMILRSGDMLSLQ